MAQSFNVDLFHGLVEAGVRHTAAELREPNGHDEAMLVELGPSATPAERVSALIAALTLRIGGVENPPRELTLQLTAGDRERLILATCARLLGPQIDLVAACPSASCRTLAEIPVRFDDIIAARPASPPESGRRIVLEGDDGRWTARCRPPTGADLEQAARGGRDAARNLMVDCLLELASPAGRVVPTTELPRACEPGLADALSAFDPAAECRIHMECFSCGQTIDAMLDGYTILRTALGGTQQIYNDVYRMARAYLWSEGEILALPMRRRRHYLAIALGAETGR